jgi:hypothetical protein
MIEVAGSVRNFVCEAGAVTNLSLNPTWTVDFHKSLISCEFRRKFETTWHYAWATEAFVGGCH